MTSFMQAYVCRVDNFNRRLGRVVMYGIFVMMGILFGHQFQKHFSSSLWT